MRAHPQKIVFACFLVCFACFDLSACHQERADRAATGPGGGGAGIALVGGTVVDPATGTAQPDAVVVLRGDRVAAVGPAASTPIPGGARVVDVKGKWIIPALIDAHVHFHQSANPYTRPDGINLTRRVPYAAEMARNKARLDATFRVWVASGVAAVNDVGGPMWNFEVREAARAAPLAPLVHVAGPLISTVARPALDLGDPPIIRVTSPDEARALAARELERRPDCVKMWFISTPDRTLEEGEAIARAAGEAAHARKVPFCVHATELATAKAALRAGADVLVHSVIDAPVDDEFLALARKNHVAYIPTLFVFFAPRLLFLGDWAPSDAERRLADPQILAAMNEAKTVVTREDLPPRYQQFLDGPRPPAAPPAPAMANLRKVWDAGITVAAGTDAGNPGVVHGPAIYRELAIYEQAGLTPAEALRSATVNGARAMGLENELGTVAPGKRADLVILDADPLAATANLTRIHRVVHAGQVLDPDAIRAALPPI
jgi:imidazolonepropionase-like amidohydrolase